MQQLTAKLLSSHELDRKSSIQCPKCRWWSVVASLQLCLCDSGQLDESEERTGHEKSSHETDESAGCGATVQTYRLER